MYLAHTTAQEIVSYLFFYCLYGIYFIYVQKKKYKKGFVFYKYFYGQILPINILCFLFGSHQVASASLVHQGFR